MLVSIITVSYNSARTIRDTLKSVEQQTYPHIEHIIVDGASTDDTMYHVDNHPHVTLSISEEDEGIYYAMNKGIEMCKGDVIGILNADDMYAHASVIEKVMNTFNDPQVQAVYADLVFVDPENTSKVKRTWRSGPYREQDLYHGWMPPHPTFFVRRTLYEQYGTFNTQLRSAADYELMLRFLLKHKINAVHLPETIVLMRHGGQSTGSWKNRWKANQEDRLAWKMNHLKPHLFTLILKPLRKINQFLNL
jgi:glycosyltransferase